MKQIAIAGPFLETMDRIRLPFLLGLLASLLAAQPAEAQILDRLKEGAQRGAERAAEREAARRADRAVTAAFGLAEDAVVCAVTDETCIEEAQAEGNDVLVVDANGDPLPASQQPSVQANQTNRAAASGGASGTSSMAPDEGVWANYDFVPGERVLYYHDFEGTRTGNFPSRLDYIAGNLGIPGDEFGTHDIRGFIFIRMNHNILLIICAAYKYTALRTYDSRRTEGDKSISMPRLLFFPFRQKNQIEIQHC